MPAATRRRGIRRWTAPGFAIAAGLVLLIASASRGRLGLGLALAGILFGYAAFLVTFARATEPAAVLRGESGDARRARIQLRASAAMGNTLALVILLGFLYQLFADGDLRFWGGLGGVAGVSYLTSIFVLARRD